jgi:hypothetical protein
LAHRLCAFALGIVADTFRIPLPLNSRAVIAAALALFSIAAANTFLLCRGAAAQGGCIITKISDR